MSTSPQPLRFSRHARLFVVMALIGPVVGFLASAVVTYVMPRTYESKTLIEVKQPPELPDGIRSTAIVCGSEFDVIRSSHCMAKVVEALKLAEHWNLDKEAALKVLKGMLHTRSARGTGLISIRVRSTDAVLARDIAREAALAYGEYRKELELRDVTRSLHELSKAVMEQEDKVEERRKVLSTLASMKGPQLEDPVVDGGKPDSSGSQRDAAIRQALDAQDYLDAKRDYELDQELLQQMKLKRLAWEIESKAPHHSVIIHDEATVSLVPCSPQVSLNLMIGLAVGFLLSLPLWLLAIGAMKLLGQPQASR